MSVDIGRLVDLIGAGVPQVAVADAFGVDPSYISQLLEREDVAAAVAEARSSRAVADIEVDTSIDDLEKLALEKMVKLLPLQTDILKINRVFQTLNGAHRRSQLGRGGVQQDTGAVVSLKIPRSAQIAFQLSVDSQIVEVGGRSMVPMASASVTKLLAARTAKRQQDVVEARVSNLLDSCKEAPAAPVISEKTRKLLDQI